MADAQPSSDAGSMPRYREIRDTLRHKILSGAWPPGYRLAPEPELARRFNCARMTMGRALTALAEQGLITRRRRTGTVVNSPRPQESVLAIHDIESEILAAGCAYRYESLGRANRAATAQDAELLCVSPGTPVLSLSGIHRTDGRPHALEQRLINLEAVPDSRRERFKKTSPGRWLLERVPWTEAEHQISAINASAPIAGHLGIARRQACLCIERRTWRNDQRITYVKLLYPSDQHRLVARFQHAG